MFLYLLSYIVMIFTYLFFVVVFNLLPLSVCRCSFLYICVVASYLCARDFFTITLGCDFPPSIVLFWIYVFCTPILYFSSFSFSHLAHVEVLLGLTAAPVRIPSHTESVPSNLHRHTPPTSQPLASTILPGTTLLRTYHRPHSFL